jgi:hypothetical protein
MYLAEAFKIVKKKGVVVALGVHLGAGHSNLLLNLQKTPLDTSISGLNRPALPLKLAD